MTNQRTTLLQRFFLSRGRLLAVIVLALLLLIETQAPIVRAGENTAGPAPSAVKTPTDDTQQKKKKKRKKSDDDDIDGTLVKGARPTPPFTLPARLPERRYIYFIAMGDWGTGGPAQHHVAQLMEAKAARDSLHFVLLLGDNFYGSGVTSVDDPQWQEKFEDVYNTPALDVPFFAVLGNHDYKKNADPNAQVEYSKRNSKWRMPARYYTFTRKLEGAATIQFFALDTEALNRTTWYDDAAHDQVAWLEKELEQSSATWKVVFGHHPVFSNGEHGNTPTMQRFIRPLLEKYNVDFYLCGHDHDRQFIKPVANVHYIVSGTAAKSRDTVWADNTIFAAADLGLMWFRVSDSEFHVQSLNKKGDIEFAYTVSKSEPPASGKAADKE